MTTGVCLQSAEGLRRYSSSERRMRFVIEPILLIIIFYCTWHGCKRGAVNAAISLAMLVIAAAAGLFISAGAADDASYLLRPFIAGCMDSQYEMQAAENAGIDTSSIEKSIAEQPELALPYIEQCLEDAGFSPSRAAHYAQKGAGIYNETEHDATMSAAQAASAAIAYAVGAVFMAALILLLFSIIRQAFGLRFRITDNASADIYGGAAFGFGYGFVCCICLCWVLSFCGILIGKGTLNDGLFSRFFLMLSTMADKIF